MKETVLHYHILEKLGEGGMGVVYKAHDEKLDRTVALKFLPHHLTASEAERARLVQEARSAAALNHPNICAVIDLEECDGEMFIVMEYVEGVHLKEKAPIQSIPEVLRLAIQIGEGLSEAHLRGIIHRDVKSENIMVTPKGQAKIMDFGLAKLKGSLKLTRTSSTLGTIAYMAPEQLQGEEADARSDIFSLGVVIYEMLTGRIPFHGEHEAARIYSVLNEEPDAIEQYRPDTPQLLADLIRRALEKDPDDRYQSAADLTAELRRIQKHTTKPVSVALPPSSSQRKGEAVLRQRGKLSHALVITGILFVVLAGALLAYLLLHNRSDTIDSVVALPFVNESHDPATEYLSDGITESLINSLSRLSNLRVIPRSTAFRYKGKDIDPEEVGAKLGVRAVLTGRVFQQGEKLNIQIELVDVQRQSQVWGEQYNHTLGELLATQQEIIRDVSQRLQPGLSRQAEQRVAAQSTENTEAYQFYLKGRYFSGLWKAEDVRKGMEYLNHAIALDSTFALSYAGLAKAYYDASGLIMPHTEGMPKARQAAEKALELDPNLGEAHLSLAMVNFLYDWDWNSAEREFQRALELIPNDPDVHIWYGRYLQEVKLTAEPALSHVQRALEIDPLSFQSNYMLGRVLVDMRRYDDLIALARRAISLDLNPGYFEHLLEESYWQKGMNDSALTIAERMVARFGRIPENLTRLATAYAYAGRKAEAERILEELQQLSRHEYIRPWGIAHTYVALGEYDKVFAEISKAFNEREEFLPDLRLDPAFDTLRKDQRYEELVRKMGFPK